LLSWGGEGGPVASMGGRWPDNHGVQKLTVCRYAFDGSDRRSLNTRASIVSHVVLTYKDFDRTRHTKHDSSLVHVIDIL
jgi:hypothetical protein